MLSIQGSFVPFGAAGFFFLWVMDPALGAGPVPGRGLIQHPQVLPPEQLYPLLRGVPHMNTVTCIVHLPGPGGLKPAKVPGLALSVAGAVQWLLDMETACADTAFQPGQSLHTWSTAAKLLLEWLARGRFIPTLRTEAGCLTAGWSLGAPESADIARLAQLETALPEVCRAIVPPDRDRKTYRPPAAGALLEQFRQTAAEAMALMFLKEAPAPVSPAGRPTAAHHWLLALAGRSGRDLPPNLPDAVALYHAVDAWAAPVTGVRGHATLRTGLRLNLPGETAHGGWELELLVQTADDPPQTVPAEAVWAAMGQDLAIGGGRYQHPEQRLLADLPAMARLFPPLQPLGLVAAPARLPVAEAAVVALLEEGAAALQEANFPVLLPAGLVRGGALQTRLHLQPPAGAGEPRFGLHQLVQVQWELALGGLPVSHEELRQLAREKRSLIQYRGQWVQVDARTLAAALRHLDSSREPVALGTALRLAPQADATTAEGWVADLLTRLQEPARMERVPAPQGFQGELRPYQQRGLDWLAFLRRYGLGACLADDMGLGKTVQLIALLLHGLEQGQEQGMVTGPNLLVCPVSLVGNWRRELARFAPTLRVLVHHGAGRATAESFADAARQHDVVITTYSLVPRDEADLAAVAWAGVVADEAQNLKNPATLHAQALRRLPAGHRIALTGTPVENHLGDLWSLFAFLNPGLLGGQEEFRRTFAIPIERYHDAEAAARLRRQVTPLILRRLKTDPDIAGDLPEKLEYTVVANLTVEQAALYEAVVQETLERAGAAAGIQRHGAVLAGLTRLKQVCNHPAAVAGDGLPLTGRSGKLDRLTEMLEEVLAEGDRALIFTQFARFGAHLQPYLARRLGCEVLFLDGSTPAGERDLLVTRFQAGGAPLFILSLKAGGVGLNLTAANHVFHFDRWWNPAVEDQATDRAYRIGQDRRVLVHKLVTAGTLEERIDRLLAEKRGLSEQIIGTGEGWLGNLSTDELRELITLERE